MPDAILSFAILGLLSLGLTWYIARSIVTYQRMGSLYKRLKNSGVLYADWPIRTQVHDASTGRASRWRASVLSMTETGLAVYPKSHDASEKMLFAHADLRWFGRPKKYTYSQNEIWLHYEREGRWQTLKAKTTQPAMMELVRALKQAAAEEQVVAYRRRRPYVHYGPVRAQPASQDIHGAWTLDEPLQLLLTPVMLVAMQDGRIARTFRLLDVQQIAALKRLDEPGSEGLLRFQTQGEQIAFSLPQHEEFARLLALAAKRSLEDPLLTKGKKADEDEDLVYDEVEDESLELLQAGFYVADDGEIHVRGA